jgi:hypothetical protein
MSTFLQAAIGLRWLNKPRKRHDADVFAAAATYRIAPVFHFESLRGQMNAAFAFEDSSNGAMSQRQHYYVSKRIARIRQGELHLR